MQKINLVALSETTNYYIIRASTFISEVKEYQEEKKPTQKKHTHVILYKKQTNKQMKENENVYKILLHIKSFLIIA